MRQKVWMILYELHRTPRIGVGSSLLCMHGCKAVSVGAHIAYVVYSRRFSLLFVEDVASHFMEKLSRTSNMVSQLLCFSTSSHSSLLFQGKMVFFAPGPNLPLALASHSSTSPSKLFHPSTSISYLRIFLSSQSDNVFKSCMLKKKKIPLPYWLRRLSLIFSPFLYHMYFWKNCPSSPLPFPCSLGGERMEIDTFWP